MVFLPYDESGGVFWGLWLGWSISRTGCTGTASLRCERADGSEASLAYEISFHSDCTDAACFHHTLAAELQTPPRCLGGDNYTMWYVQCDFVLLLTFLGYGILVETMVRFWWLLDSPFTAESWEGSDEGDGALSASSSWLWGMFLLGASLSILSIRSRERESLLWVCKSLCRSSEATERQGLSLSWASKRFMSPDSEVCSGDVRLDRRAMLLTQSGQRWEISPVWVSSCSSRWHAKFFPHSTQIKHLPSVLTSWPAQRENTSFQFFSLSSLEQIW